MMMMMMMILTIKTIPLPVDVCVATYVRFRGKAVQSVFLEQLIQFLTTICVKTKCQACFPVWFFVCHIYFMLQSLTKMLPYIPQKVNILLKKKVTKFVNHQSHCHYCLQLTLIDSYKLYGLMVSILFENVMCLQQYQD